MAEIPTYAFPQVQAEAAPEVQVHLDTRGAFDSPMAGAGHALGGVVSGAQEAYQQARQKADAAAVMDAEVEAEKRDTTYRYNPDSGIMLQRGENAVAAADGYQEHTQKNLDDISQNLLSNDAQRRMFKLRMGARAQDWNRQVEEHVGQQVEAANIQSSVDLQKLSLDKLSQPGVYNDKTSRDIQLAAPEGPISAVSLSATDREAKLANWRQLAQETILSEYFVHAKDGPEQYQAAKDYFADENVKRQLGSKLHDYEVKWDLTQKQAGGDEIAQHIIQANLDESGRPIEGAVWAQVDKEVPPGPFRAAVQERTEFRLNRALKSYEQAEQDRLGRITTTIESTGGNLDLSSDDFQQLSPADKAKAWEKRNAILRTDRGEQNSMDREELRRFSALDRDLQASVDIASQFPSASQSARYQMKALQNTVKEKLGKGALEPLKDFDEQLKGVAVQLNLQKQDAGELKAQLDSWYMGKLRDNNGKPPTREEVDRELSARLQYSKGSWFFGVGKQYRFQADPAETFEPGAEQPYEAANKKAGVPPARPVGTHTEAPPAPNAVGPGTQAGSGGQRPAPTPAAPGTRRITRTNPKTGETRTWNGKAWVPGG